MTTVPNVRELSERFEQAASDTFAPLRIRPDKTTDATGPAGMLRSARPGQVLVTRVTGGPCTVVRTQSLIRSGDQKLVKVALHGRERAGVEQDGRQFLPGPGDLLVYETTRLSEPRFWEPFDIVVLGIPRILLGPHTHPLAARTATAVPTESGGGRQAVQSPRLRTPRPYRRERREEHQGARRSSGGGRGSWRG
ncbi:AraC-like ligand-binding domain-containing protein [Streptomyces sp. NPDC054794]